MKNLIFFKLTALLSFISITASAKPEYCAMKSSELTTKVPIATKPSYFFRVFPKSNFVSFASNSHNFLLDMTTFKIFDVPGSYDPVPLGEKVMSVPNKTFGMMFYSVDDILKNQKPEPLYNSRDMLGVYQSTGLIKKTKDYEIYGLISASTKTIQFQKIKINYYPEVHVTPVDEVSEICSDWDIKLPMLSKDSKEISGFDATAGVSKIWKIDPDKKSCVEVDNLGVFAAKADFSFDSRKLVFHMNANGFTYELKDNGSGEVNWLENPTSEMSQSVFQYDRDAKTLTRISFNEPGSNAYYPVYKSDGSVLYAVVEASGASRFEIVNAEEIKSNKSLRLYDQTQRTQMLSLLAIGKLFNLTCSPDVPIKSPETLLVTSLGLNQKNCIDLVNTNWNKETQLAILKADIVPLRGSRIYYRRDLMSVLEKSDLFKVCHQLEDQ